MINSVDRYKIPSGTRPSDLNKPEEKPFCSLTSHLNSQLGTSTLELRAWKIKRQLGAYIYIERETERDTERDHQLTG